jgi:hypothetical protein
LLFPLSVVIWNFWLMFQTLIMGTHSITRERTGNNLELLLVTGVDIRTIIWAKWQAIVRQQWRDYALLAIMRIGAISFLAMNFTVALNYGDHPSFSYGRPGPEVEPQITIVFSIAIAIVLLSAVVIAILTMLDLMFTAACAIVGGSIARRISLALPYSIGVRLLLVIVVALLLGVPSYLAIKPDLETFGYYPDPVFNTFALIAGLTGATMLDQGSIAAGFLMRYGYNFRWSSIFNGFWFFSDTLRGHGPAYLTALVISVVIFIFLTSTLMWRAKKSLNWQS